MKARRDRRLRVLAACGLIVLYAALSHYCNARGAHHLGAALALAPMTAVVIALIWKSSGLAIATLATAAIGSVLFQAWPLLQRNSSVLNLIEEGTVYSLLGISFARTLTDRRVALCTQLAAKIHGPLSPREVLYTRRVTLLWSVFFFMIVLSSLSLFLLAPLWIWSLYSNFCVLPLVAVVFAAEYAVRRRVLPEASGPGLLATMRVYFVNPR